jgi:hypothetical protein
MAIKRHAPPGKEIAWVGVDRRLYVSPVWKLELNLTPPVYYFTNYFHAWAYYLKVSGGKK